MESRNYLSRGINQYQNLNNQNISKIMLKNGSYIEVNNNSVQSKYGDKSYTRNYPNVYSSVNSDPRMKKFNSYSTKARYKINQNNGHVDGFYVIPILNAPKRIITVQVPENNIIELGKDNYHVENVTFQTSPKKYTYKPYKQPKRKNKLKLQYSTNYQSYQSQKKNYNSYNKYPGYKKKY